MIKRLAFLLSMLVMGAAAHAQVVPSGSFTAGHTVKCLNAVCTVFGDAGGATPGIATGYKGLTELGITNTGTPLCVNDALTNAVGGYHQLCVGANSLGGGLISYQNYGAAAALPFSIVVNGTAFQTPGTISGMPFVADTATLKTEPSTFSTFVTRIDSVTGYGAPPLVYQSTNTACSLNAGAGDNGSQIPTSNSKCWVAIFPSGVADLREWGAACNDTTTDTTAITAAFAANALQLSGGWTTLNVPTGGCKISSVTVPMTNGANSPAPRLRIQGASPANSYFDCTSTSTPCFNATAGAALDALFIIDGVGFKGPSKAAGSVGLALTNLAFFDLRSIEVQGFDLGLHSIGSLSFKLDSATITGNNRGCLFESSGGIDANAIVFIRPEINLNTTYGCYFIGGSNVTFVGGAIEGNGSGGGSSWGLRGDEMGGNLSNAVTKYGFNIVGTYFEQNWGAADVYLSQTVGAVNHNISGGFLRCCSATNFTTNNILAAGSAGMGVNISGSTFTAAAPYPNSSSRKDWAATNTLATFNTVAASYSSAAADPGSFQLLASAGSIVESAVQVTSSSGNVARFRAHGPTSDYWWYVPDNLNEFILHDGNANADRMLWDGGGYRWHQNNPIATASLPSCDASHANQEWSVSDATAPTYMGALVGGGAIPVQAVCKNGTGWLTR